MTDAPASHQDAAAAAPSGGGDEKTRARARVGLTVNGKYRID